MKRFYKTVSTGPATGGGFVVLLDDRPVRTPGKNLMAMPNLKLAAAIGAEWDAQNDEIDPATMPLTQIATTALDGAQAREVITEDALRYLDSDLLCYRAPEPDGLKAEQSLRWDPWLSWFEKRFGVALETTFTLIRLDQPKAAHAAVRQYVNAMEHHRFTVFQTVVAMTGSIVLALALDAGAIAPDAAWECALCEELLYEKTHDLERHGLDPTEEKRRHGLRRDLVASAAYLAAL